ncbi:MAG: FkbM family methyltransferase [candidate division WOR-3 bacterium]
MLEIIKEIIGSENKFVKFELKESTVCSRISEKDEDLINVKMITIDSFVKEYKIPHIDIMKIDVEGYALEVLKGAIHVLPVTKGIVMEYHPPHENIKEIENFLKNYNFEKVLTFFEYVYFINKNAFSSINS